MSTRSKQARMRRAFLREGSCVGIRAVLREVSRPLAEQGNSAAARSVMRYERILADHVSRRMAGMSKAESIAIVNRDLLREA